jgi:DNA helicase HerA-like ATPase
MPRASFEELAPPRRTLDGWLATGHKAIFAKTGAGKSRMMKRFQRRTQYRSLFITPNDDLPPGSKARLPQDVGRLYGQGAKHVVWRAPKGREVEGGREEALRLLGVIVGILIAIGKRLMRGEKAPVWLVVFVDEVHNFTSKTGYPGPIEELLAEGRKYGIVVVVASQRPARVSLEVIGQADRVVLLKLEPPDAKYLRQADYPLDEFEAWTERDFHFAVMAGKKWLPYRPLND